MNNFLIPICFAFVFSAVWPASHEWPYCHVSHRWTEWLSVSQGRRAVFFNFFYFFIFLIFFNFFFYSSTPYWLVSLRPRLHEDDVKTIGTKSYLSGKKSFRIGLLFTRRRSVSANFWRRYEDDRKSGNFWRRYGNDRPSSSCKHHIRIDRSGSYQIVIAMRWPRTQASQSCIFSARVGLSCWRVGLLSESIPSFEARSWQGVAMRHKEEQRRAAASLLILLIVAQALLLLLSSSCRHVRLSRFLLFLGSMYLLSCHFLFDKCF